MSYNRTAVQIADKLMPVKIKIAERKEDLEVVFRFRYDIYVRQMDKAVLGADHDHGIITDDLDSSSNIFAATEDGNLQGTLRVTYGRSLSEFPEIFKENISIYGLQPFMEEIGLQHLSFTSRLMVSPEIRGTTTLGRMVSEVYKKGLHDGIQFDFCVSAPYLAQMYAQLGYRRYKSSIVDPSFGYDIPMVLVLRDADHLKICRSPFLRLLKQFDPDDTNSEVNWFHRDFADALSEYDAQSLDLSDVLDSIMQPRGILSSETVFAGLTIDELQDLQTHTFPLRFEADDHIIRQEDQRDEMFIVLSGQLSVTLPGNQSAHTTLGPGDIFGEIGLLTSTGRSADVIAQESGTALILTRQTMLRLMKNRPELAAKLLFNVGRTLSTRIIRTNQLSLKGHLDG
jgi:CRP-like cAMP-binding protein